MPAGGIADKAQAAADMTPASQPPPKRYGRPAKMKAVTVREVREANGQAIPTSFCLKAHELAEFDAFCLDLGVSRGQAILTLLRGQTRAQVLMRAVTAKYGMQVLEGLLANLETSAAPEPARFENGGD